MATRIRTNKSGFILIASIFLALFLGIIISISFFRANIELNNIDHTRASTTAFYAAQTGIERAIFELRRDINWRAGFSHQDLIWQDGEAGQVRVGYYDVVAQDGGLFEPSEPDSPQTIWIRSQGIDSGEVTPRVIFSRVMVVSPTKYFISTLGDLTIQGGAEVTGAILGRDIIFEPQGADIIMHDKVYYLRNWRYADPGDEEQVHFDDGAPEGPKSIIFPSVDFNYYRGIAQNPANPGRYIGCEGGCEEGEGNFTYDGEINPDKLEANNGLVVAEGDIYITGNVTGSVLFVAGGNIYINGDIIKTDPESAAQLGLFSKGDIIIPEAVGNDLAINAFLFADGGMVRAEGDKYSRGTLNFTGAISTRGRDGERTAIDLNVFKERNYVYDESLFSRPAIPFMTYMVSVLDWREASLQDTFPPPAPTTGPNPAPH